MHPAWAGVGGNWPAIDGINDDGYILIRDPWQGTRYKMIKDDLLLYWTQQGVYRKRR